MSKLIEMEAKIKKELSKFLANQSKLIEARDAIEKLKNIPDYAVIKAKINQLYNLQGVIEKEAMNWLAKLSEQKALIFSQPDIKSYVDKGEITAGIFKTSFWRGIGRMASSSLPLINEGIKLSGNLVNQNNEVDTIYKSMRAGKLLKPTAQFGLMSASMIWIYGILGVGLAYHLGQKKKGALR